MRGSLHCDDELAGRALWQQVPVVATGGDLQVWRVFLDFSVDEIPEGRAWLSQAETERSERYHFVTDRNRFVASRIALRLFLGSILKLDPATVAFSHGPTGKPALAGSSAGLLHFNIAHAAGLMVCAISESRDVGVDVENVREVPEAAGILDVHFPRETGAAWRALPKEEQAEAFLRLWVQHEARLKRSGMGLGLAEGELPEPVRGAMSGETVLEFVPATGFVGAVVF